MSNKGPVVFNDPDKLADFVIEKAGKNLVLGMQLGLGKPNNIANALYRKAKSDPSIKLKILTALSLETPTWSSDLERRFMEPLVERIWGGYVDLEYARDVRLKKLPPNVEVGEFFYKAGAFMNNNHMQQNYISTNYTHAARDVLANGMNVAGALLAAKEIDGNMKYSVSCNGDTALDALDLMREKEKKDPSYKAVAVGEINKNLPFMYGDAVADPSEFDAVLEGPQSDFTLFGAPKEAINATDYMIGIHASTLIPDGGTLQIGIGSLGDAIAYGLISRHKENSKYKAFLEEAGILERYSDLIERVGGYESFDKGIYGSTEMMVDSFVDMYKNDVMRRRCYDDEHIQQLVNEEVFKNYKVTPEGLVRLVKDGAVPPKLNDAAVNYLKYFGIFKDDVILEGDTLKCKGQAFSSDLRDSENLKAVVENCLGTDLKHGYWIHAGFFLGPRALYKTLYDMSDEERALINMTSVLNVNQLYANNNYSSEKLKVLQRQKGRFINAGLMVSLSGAIASDGLDNGKVISGIGGQYNFVSLAHALSDARGALMIRSTRESGGQINSNVVYNYAHCSVPRHLRDIVITEYGIADLRSRSDKDVIKELLNVCDSRFQNGLLEKAKQNGKIESDYTIPSQYTQNYPEKIEKLVESHRKEGLFPLFPFGTDFTDEEVAIGKALKMFKAKADKSKMSIIPGIFKAFTSSIPEGAKPYLERLALDKPSDFKEKLLQKIVISALKNSGAV
ncbi:MAG: acetyl-CoA hydrolase/transferase C-terminal domain-containing protein [Desulforegulaceae bacterium]|nr:acetyl-CoA hydrolase/transferase C-terminal domain-containing protein [Desulforegulaceae bacterium]